MKLITWLLGTLIWTAIIALVLWFVANLMGYEWHYFATSRGVLLALVVMRLIVAGSSAMGTMLQHSGMLPPPPF